MNNSAITNRTRAKVRGGVGVLFVILGLIVVGQIVTTVIAKSGYRFESIGLMVPGVALGGAMVALGVVRIRAALRYLKSA